MVCHSLLQSDCQRNINNLIFTEDTTLTAESEEELKSLLMKVKEEREKHQYSTLTHIYGI